MPSSLERSRSLPERYGWTLLVWFQFADRYRQLVGAVRALRNRDPHGYGAHPQAKLLAAVNRLILEAIPMDPGGAEFRQGNTLGPAHRHWQRAKFLQRFRLFFRFHSGHQIIVYVWMSDDGTRRKEGARTDPYHVFRKMLEAGSPPANFDELVRQSEPLDVPPPDAER